MLKVQINTKITVITKSHCANNLVTLHAGPREGHRHAAILVADVAQHLPAASHKVPVVAWVHSHGLLHHLVQLLDGGLQLLLGLGDGVLGRGDQGEH